MTGVHLCVCVGEVDQKGGGACRTFAQTRDTAFRSLRELTSGDRIAREGKWRRPTKNILRIT